MDRYADDYKRNGSRFTNAELLAKFRASEERLRDIMRKQIADPPGQLTYARQFIAEESSKARRDVSHELFLRGFKLCVGADGLREYRPKA